MAFWSLAVIAIAFWTLCVIESVLPSAKPPQSRSPECVPTKYRPHFVGQMTERDRQAVFDVLSEDERADLMKAHAANKILLDVIGSRGASLPDSLLRRLPSWRADSSTTAGE